MASARYTRFITPEEPQEHHEMTPKEKRANFWYYYKWHFLIGAVALLLVGMFIFELVSRVDPDYTFGLISSQSVPDTLLTTLDEQLATLVDDRNGDGKVVVSVQQYTLATGSEGEAMDAYTQMAGVTRLASDAQLGSSMLYLTDNVQGFQESQGLFAYNDDTVPAEGEAVDYTRMGLKWMDSPVLSALPLGEVTDYNGQTTDYQSYMQNFTLVKRVFTGTDLERKDELVQYHADCNALFDAWTT